ncbi:hypothetical protein [Enterococcus sp. AZ163]|uniref:hypothetical protein n=1 Tax=Enterococcus sp. AZ163 TaxID=2774638 RepID=UPI003D2D4029
MNIVKLINSGLVTTLIGAVCTLVIAKITVNSFDKIRVKREFLNEIRNYTGTYLGECLAYIRILEFIKKDFRENLLIQYLEVQKAYAQLKLRFGEKKDNKEYEIIDKLEKEITKSYRSYFESGEKLSEGDLKELYNEITNSMVQMENYFYKSWKGINNEKSDRGETKL